MTKSKTLADLLTNENDGAHVRENRTEEICSIIVIAAILFLSFISSLAGTVIFSKSGNHSGAGVTTCQTALCPLLSFFFCIGHSRPTMAVATNSLTFHL